MPDTLYRPRVDILAVVSDSSCWCDTYHDTAFLPDRCVQELPWSAPHAVCVKHVYWQIATTVVKYCFICCRSSYVYMHCRSPYLLAYDSSSRQPCQHLLQLALLSLVCNLSYSTDGCRRMVPQLLEVNYSPDNERICKYFPDFYNDAFTVLFLDDGSNHSVIKLVWRRNTCTHSRVVEQYSWFSFQ